MAKQFFICRALTGGLKGCLDHVPGYNLNDNDSAITITNDAVYFHEAKKKSYEDSLPPFVIKPRYNNYGRRWHLTNAINAHNYKDANILKGHHFFGEPEDPTTEGFVFWARNNDVCVKIKNRFNRLKFFTLARFSEMQKISRKGYDLSYPQLKNTIFKKWGIAGGSVNDLDGITAYDIVEDDFAVVSTDKYLCFYTAKVGSPVSDFPNVVLPTYGSGFYWELVGAIGDMSFGEDVVPKGRALNSEPPNPPPGTYIMWMSNGVGLGDSGDFLVKVTNQEGETRYKTIVDFSALGAGGRIVDPNKFLKDEASSYESVEVTDKYIEALYTEILHTVEDVKIVDHSGVFIDDSFYGDDDYHAQQQIVIADYDESTDSITYIEKVKYINLWHWYKIWDSIENYLSALYDDDCISEDIIGVNSYILLEDVCFTDDEFLHHKAYSTVKDKLYSLSSRLSLFSLVEDQSTSVDDVLLHFVCNVGDYSESVGDVFDFNTQTKVKDTVDDIYEIQDIVYSISIDEVVAGSLSLSTNKEDIVVVEKPQITIDDSTGVLTPTIDAGTFRVSNGDDIHEKTDWIIYDEGMRTVYKKLGSTEYLTELQIPENILFYGEAFVVRVRFYGEDLGSGFWDQEIYEI